MTQSSRRSFIKTGAISMICAFAIGFNTGGLAASTDSTLWPEGKHINIGDATSMDLTDSPCNIESKSEILRVNVRKNTGGATAITGRIAGDNTLSRNDMKRIENNIEKTLEDRRKERARAIRSLEKKHTTTPTNIRLKASAKNNLEAEDGAPVIEAIDAEITEDGSIRGQLPLSLLPKLAISLVNLLNRDSFINDPLGIKESKNYSDLICEFEQLDRIYNSDYDSISKKSEISHLILPLKKFYQEISTPMMDAIDSTIPNALFEDLRELDDILNLIALFALHHFNTLLPSPRTSRV